MDFSTKVDTVKSGWSIVYIERSQVIFSTNKNIFLSLMTNLSWQTMQYLMKCSIIVAFHLDLHCLQMYQFRGLKSTKSGIPSRVRGQIFNVSLLLLLYLIYMSCKDSSEPLLHTNVINTKILCWLILFNNHTRHHYEF